MSDTPLPVLDYWNRVFGHLTISGNDGTLSITMNPGLDRRRRVMILTLADGPTRVALTPEVAARIGLDRDTMVTADALRARLAANGMTLHDPDLLFYAGAQAAEPPTTDPGRLPRRLTEADRKAFETFQKEAPDQDREDAFVELDHWLVFGRFEGDRLVSAASMYPWDGSLIADLGALTLPDARGRGHARAVVRAICRHARGLGHEPQYRCQLDNAASVALARASGFTPFGMWEVIRSEDGDQDGGASV